MERIVSTHSLGQIGAVRTTAICLRSITLAVVPAGTEQWSQLHYARPTDVSCNVWNCCKWCLVQGLRLHDNPALQAAITEADTLVPVFCLDPWFISSGAVGPTRLNFLLQSLQNLDDNLQKCNGRLIVLHGDPKDVLPGVAEALHITHAFFEKDTEPYALERDKAVSASFHKLGVEVCGGPTHASSLWLWCYSALATNIVIWTC